MKSIESEPIDHKLASVALLFGTLFAGIPAEKALAAPQNPEADVDTVVKVMQDSGFIVSDTGFGSKAFQSNKDGTYKITARLKEAVATENCQIAKDKKGNSAESLICYVASWEAPAGFEANLANTQTSFSAYWKAVNNNQDFPTYVGAGEIPNPIESTVFPLNSEINKQLVDTQAGVWETCFSPEGRSKKAVAGHDRKECRGNKYGLELAAGDAAIAEKDAVIAKNNAVIAKNNAVIAKNNAVIAKNNAVIAEKDAVIAEKDAVLKQKQEELAREKAETARAKAETARAKAKTKFWQKLDKGEE